MSLIKALLVLKFLVLLATSIKAKSGDIVVCLGIKENKEKVIEFEATVIEVSNETGELILNGINPKELKDQKIAIHPRACAKKDPVRIEGELYEEKKVVFYESVEPKEAKERTAKREVVRENNFSQEETQEVIKKTKISETPLKEEISKLPEKRIIKDQVPKTGWSRTFNKSPTKAVKKPIENKEAETESVSKKDLRKKRPEPLVMRYIDFLQE